MLIQKLRLQRGWSQEQLALVSGLSTRTVQRLERGQTASLESLKALAAAFSVDVSTLQETATMSEAVLPKTVLPAPSLAADEIVALSRARQIREFYTHLIQFVLVLSALSAMSWTLQRDHSWLLYVAAAWGAALLFHALRAFGVVPLFGAEWERAKVEQLLGRKLG